MLLSPASLLVTMGAGISAEVLDSVREVLDSVREVHDKS
jgi:hypothetical protein